LPVRSLSSSVFTWPDQSTVVRALNDWAERAVDARPDLLRVGYFGSYARGDWGVGSDLDVIIVVRESSTPLIRRAAEWDLTRLPVPADVLVYTESEWRSLAESGIRFARVARDEVVWLILDAKRSSQSRRAAVEG
jgi:predicted nucleotidyltransferase